MKTRTCKSWLRPRLHQARLNSHRMDQVRNHVHPVHVMLTNDHPRQTKSRSITSTSPTTSLISTTIATTSQTSPRTCPRPNPRSSSRPSTRPIPPGTNIHLPILPLSPPQLPTRHHRPPTLPLLLNPHPNPRPHPPLRPQHLHPPLTPGVTPPCPNLQVRHLPRPQARQGDPLQRPPLLERGGPQPGADG